MKEQMNIVLIPASIVYDFTMVSHWFLVWGNIVESVGIDTIKMLALVIIGVCGGN